MGYMLTPLDVTHHHTTWHNTLAPVAAPSVLPTTRGQVDLPDEQCQHKLLHMQPQRSMYMRNSTQLSNPLSRRADITS
jgi:hypothetical protein